MTSLRFLVDMNLSPKTVTNEIDKRACVAHLSISVLITLFHLWQSR